MSKIGLKVFQNSKFDDVRELLAPYTSRAYFVGGCVRDALLGCEVYDYDIEVYDITPDDFDTILSSVGASGVGKSYFIYKFKNYDIGLPRKESKVGSLHRDFEVSYCNDEYQASIRRDFSINAMMVNIFDGEFLDFHGGFECLKDKVLKHIDDNKFCEDPLRVLRAVQFAARFDFKIDDKTLSLMKTLSLEHLSSDRIVCELIKFFKSKHLEVGAFYLYRLGLFERFFGIKISKYELDIFLKKLKISRKFIDDERLFIYILCGYFKLDLKKISNDLKLPKIYERLADEPYFSDEPSDFEILKIATQKPLSKWLGLYNEKRLKRAKNLGFYNKKFEIKVDINSLLRQGFFGKSLGEKIELERQKKIFEFIDKANFNIA